MKPEEMAALMGRAYRHQAPWGAADIAALSARPVTRLIRAPEGFLIAQVVADEAEILALATDPAAQRQGVASDLLTQFHDLCAREGVTRAVLDVAHDNGPALALYTRFDYAETARRAGYYRRADGSRADALLMARAIGPDNAASPA